MPPPIRVELLPHDPSWAGLARDEAASLHAALGDALVAVHHVGSTAIAGIHAKPILDLMPVVRGLRALDARRYCSKDDPGTGRRLVQLHAYAEGAHDVARHLAFRDFLRRHPGLAAQYDREERRCQRLHPLDSHAYGHCKGAWIGKVEARALAAVAAVSPSME